MISINEIMRQPIYEPKKRWCGGTYGWVAHRFPVKGGISMRDVWMHDTANALYNDVVGKHPLIELFRKNGA
jgi:hypothetical protein